MESCARLVGMLQEFTEGVMASEGARRVSAHLEVCAACRKRARVCGEIVDALERLPQISPAPEFRSRVMARVMASPLPIASAGRRSRLRLVHRLVGAAVALASAAGATGSYLVSRSSWSGFGRLEPGLYQEALESLGRVAFSFLLEIVTRAELPVLFTSHQSPSGWGLAAVLLLALGCAAAAIGLGIFATARSILLPPRR